MMLYLTESALKGSPLWKTTFCRSVNCIVLSSSRFQAVARSGETVLPSRSTLTSGSYMCRSMLSAIVPTCVCGSMACVVSWFVPQTRTSSLGFVPCGLPGAGFWMFVLTWTPTVETAPKVGDAPPVVWAAGVLAAAAGVLAAAAGLPAAAGVLPVAAEAAGLVAAAAPVVAVGAVLEPPQAASTALAAAAAYQIRKRRRLRVRE